MKKFFVLFLFFCSPLMSNRTHGNTYFVEMKPRECSDMIGDCEFVLPP